MASTGEAAAASAEKGKFIRTELDLLPAKAEQERSSPKTRAEANTAANFMFGKVRCDDACGREAKWVPFKPPAFTSL